MAERGEDARDDKSVCVAEDAAGAHAHVLGIAADFIEVGFTGLAMPDDARSELCRW